MARLVLASASPRRRDILSALGAQFSVIVAPVPEFALPEEPPHQTVERLARKKTHAAAQTIARELGSASVILGADTGVVLDGALLGKPQGTEDAARMLRMLSGRVHEVLTGVALLEVATQRVESGASRTLVRFAPLSDAEIAAYIASGEPMDKAGAYGIQERGAWFIEGIEGSYTNVVGLPVELLRELARRFGLSFEDLTGA